MAETDYYKMVYGQRIIWLDQQLKSGKSLEELLDTRVKAYQQRGSRDLMIDVELPKSEDTKLSCNVNIEVMKKWKQFTTGRPQNDNTILSMAMWEFMSKHAV